MVLKRVIGLVFAGGLLFSAGAEVVIRIAPPRVLVEKIPALVCEHCGEATFSRETTERIRRMVHGAGRPVKTVPMDVFAMA